MRLDTRDPDIRYVQISHAEKQTYAQHLRMIVGEEFDDLLARLAKRLYAFRAGNTVTLTSIFSERCSFSLLALFTNEENPFASDALGAFYCKYFVMAFEAAEENSKRQLLGRFRSGMKQPGQLSQLFFELAVANTFRRRGHEVILVAEDGSPDLKIQTKVTVANIECKCISVEAGSPIPKRILEGATELARTLANGVSSANDRHYLHISFNGNSCTEYPDAMSSLNSHIQKIRTGHSLSSDRYWEVSREKMSQAAQSVAIKDDLLAMLDQTNKDFPEFAGACLLVPGSDCVLLSTKTETRLHRAVNEAISKACQQLPADGVRAVFVQLSGVLAQQPKDPFSAMAENIKHITRNQDLRRRHLLHSKMKNGYIGIVFCSDFYEVEDENGLGVDYSTAVYRTLHDPDYWIYEFDLMRWTPSQHFERMIRGGIIDTTPSPTTEQEWHDH